MVYKYGDIIRLKEGVRPRMSLDIDTFFNLPDEDIENGKENGSGDGEKNKVRTFWGLPESAFETDDMGTVYLKAEYARRLVWAVDDVSEPEEYGCIKDGCGSILNINVAYDPEGVVNCGAFCSFVNEEDVEDYARNAGCKD